MLPQHDNDQLTRVGPATPMGDLMRRYWIPAAFSQQISQRDGPPVRVRLLGENLVLFRDTQGRIGLLDERCPHRTASLFLLWASRNLMDSGRNSASTTAMTSGTTPPI